MNYWLMKSEPSVFGIDVLAAARGKRSAWDGVRNYQVRNMLRDQMKNGDLAFFYHSSCEVPGIYGIVRVVKEGYPDSTAFDAKHHHYDAGSDPDKPRWYMVDVVLERKLRAPITLETLKQRAASFPELLILRRGNRLSITPVSLSDWQRIIKLESA